MKKYSNAELLIVRMQNNDIVTTSTMTIYGTTLSGNQLAPGQRGLDDWDAGY